MNSTLGVTDLRKSARAMREQDLDSSVRSTVVSRLTGATLHQLRYWDTSRLVRPSIQETGGTPGVPRLWSRADVRRIRTILRRLDEGESLQEIRRGLES